MRKDVINLGMLGDALQEELEACLKEFLGNEGISYDSNIAADDSPFVSAVNKKEKWKYEFRLHVERFVHPSRIHNLVKSLSSARRRDNQITILGAPKLSRESRYILREICFPYVDLAGGFFLPLQFPGSSKPSVYYVDRQNEYHPEDFIQREGPGYPGVSKGRAAIYRALLTNPGKTWGVRELSRYAMLDAGTTSGYLAETVNAGWVERRSRTEHIVVDPTALLDYWVEMSRRIKKETFRYQLAAKDYTDLRTLVSNYLSQVPDSYHTMWSGAEFYGPFQEQPIVAVYHPKPKEMRKYFGYRMVGPTQLANIWILRNPDKAMGIGSTSQGAERVVCWQQVYVDLMNTPHRGKSIAHMLRDHMEKIVA
jgi:hypothetical protein